MTMLARLRRRLRVSDDTGSLPFVMLLTVVGLGLSVVLGTVVLGQQQNTRVERQRDAALNAAQSGIDAGLANMRAATRTDGTGDPARLPCSTVAGTTGADATSAYSARLYYLASSPPSGNVAWADTNRLACPLTVLPAYAMIVSTGRAGTATTARTLTATYAFTSSVQNDKIEGGVVKVYDLAGVGNSCLTAGSTPAAGVQLGIETCDAGRPGQQFMWQAGLTIGLKNTNLCADGRTNAADPTERAGNRVTLQTCSTSTLAPNQQWSQNDYAAFIGTSDGTSLNDFCWNIVSNRIVLADQASSTETCEGSWGEEKSFFPSSEMGSGRAGWNTGQLVNSDQFGRCVDVTADDVTFGFLIVFPCKQNVTGTVLWNQTWDLPAVPTEADVATGYIYTTWSGRTYCLESPGSTTTADRGDGTATSAVRLTMCTPTGTPAAKFAWTVRFDTGRWSTSYRIESTYNATAGGNCLSAVELSGPATTQWTTSNLQFSKLVVATCNGGDLQKWNAISLFHESSLSDITEP